MKLNVKTAKNLIYAISTLIAIEPILEKTGVQFYISFSLFMVLFSLFSVYYIVKAHRESPKNILKLAFRTPRERLCLIFICTVGAAIGYFMEDFERVIIWTAPIVTTLFIMLIPAKKKAE